MFKRYTFDITFCMEIGKNSTYFFSKWCFVEKMVKMYCQIVLKTNIIYLNNILYYVNFNNCKIYYANFDKKQINFYIGSSLIIIFDIMLDKVY